jgi:hypothetical protein
MSVTSDKTLADPEQLIDDLQRQLAECRTERDEALAQQTATAEVLQVINSSHDDLAPVFDAILERALRLCEASFGILFIRRGDRFRGVATRNLPLSLADFVRERFQPSPAGFFEKAARGQAFEHITDLSAEAPRVAGDPRARAFVELGGARIAEGALRGPAGSASPVADPPSDQLRLRWPRKSPGKALFPRHFRKAVKEWGLRRRAWASSARNITREKAARLSKKITISIVLAKQLIAMREIVFEVSDIIAMATLDSKIGAIEGSYRVR